MKLPNWNRIRSHSRRQVADALVSMPEIRGKLLAAEDRVHQFKGTVATLVPEVIRARPRRLMISLTAHCNLRCHGCRYGRDFMPAHQLSLGAVRGILEDARDAGIEQIRLYGGEPLLHPDLPEIVRYTRSLGLMPTVTTNATLLESRLDSLYDAGLRDITVGFYGLGNAFDEYTQRNGRSKRFARGIELIRARYGNSIDLQLNWLLRRQTCNVASLAEGFQFAMDWGAKLQIDLVHYSLPYFTEGDDQWLQFRADDREALEEVARELVRLKTLHPQVIQQSIPALRAIPDWALRKAEMRVPCLAGNMLWIGPDGTVQLCYVTFKLGNVHEKRLRDMLFTAEHHSAARSAFLLQCPNCHCSAGERVMRHRPTRIEYE